MKRKFAPVQTKYMKAKAMHETIKKLEKQAEVKILRENIFYSELSAEEIALGEKVERITNPNGAFMMNESDFTTYCKLTHDEYTRLGIEVPDYNTTADHQSRKALNKAEKDLIHWGHEQVKGLPQFQGKHKQSIQDLYLKADELMIEHRNELIDLTMHLQAV